MSGGRSSRAKKPPRPPGQCTACNEKFPLTAEFFVLLREPKKNWSGWSSECRICRNTRFREAYANDREAYIKRVTDYQTAKPEKKRARNMKRYASKLHATPAWADQRKIETIYAIAGFLTRRTGVKHQVDHFYPLMGKTSCGLHVAENMRVLSAKANQQKGNREPLAVAA